ncbi:lysophospholipid acyltransferase family protein [Patescibacteria group bacterium]
MGQRLVQTLSSWAASRVENIEGFENLPVHGPALLVPNHISYFDPLVLFGVLYTKLKRSLHFMSFGEYWRFPGGRKLGQWTGTTFVERNSPASALKHLQRHLEKGEICVLYPEGSRNIHAELLRGKTGAARLALWTKTPVIPIGITGPATRSAIRSWIYFFQKKKFHIRIGESISLEEYYNRPITGELLHEVTGRIMKAISTLSGKPYTF